MTNQPLATSLLYSPEQSARIYVDYAKLLKDAPGITWGVPSMDREIVPLHPGDVVGIIARSGHGKSTVSAYMAMREAQRIRQSKSTTQGVVYATFEQSVEEMEALFHTGTDYNVTDLAWGRVPMERVEYSAEHRMGLPIWMVGRSISRRKATPPMTVANVYGSIRSMEEQYGIKPTLIVLDYIQTVTVMGKHSRQEEVAEAVRESKDLAIACGCPILIGVQASRSVDKAVLKIPTAGDCQWASEIEQTCDKLLGIWRPWLTRDDDVTLRIHKETIPITERLFIARLQKQRMAPAGKTFILDFAPELVRLSDMELRGGL